MQSLLAIDDHDLFRAGLGLLVKSYMPAARFEAVGSIEAALARPGLAPDLILLDLKLDGVGGLEGLPLLKARWPAARVLVVSSDMDADLVRQSVERGADAFASKADTPEQIMAMITTLIGIGADDPSGGALTPRQLEILRLLQGGLSNKAIARRLGLSEFTVRGHVQNILRHLGVGSRTGAVFEAQRSGLL